MPVGVITNTLIKSAPGVVPAGPEARFFVAGLAERGPVDAATRVRSLGDFQAAFGGAVSYSSLYEGMKQFFAEGGDEAYVARLVGSAAAKATLSLDTGKIVVTAIEPGAYGNTYKAKWTAASKTLQITTHLGVERYTGTTAALLLEAAAKSTTVTVTSSGTLPSADVAEANLASGADDQANVTSATAIAALALFTDQLGAGAVALPGYAAATVGSDLITHARTYKRVALLAGARTDTLAQTQTAADALRSADSEGNAGYFWPWVKTFAGVTISPEYAVAGRRAAAIRSGGPWTAPAGGNGVLASVAAVDQATTKALANTAHDDHAVSVITKIAGGNRLYGWRSLALDELNLRYLHYRDTLNMIRVNVETALEPYVYAPMNQALAQSAVGAVQGVLRPLITGGALYPLTSDEGAVLDEGYAVGVDMRVGPNGEGILEPTVSVRLAPSAELITVPITKVAVGAAL